MKNSETYFKKQTRLNNNGITLMELIVAISLLSLVMFAGTGIYLSGWNLSRDAQAIAQAQRNATLPMIHITKNLKEAIRFGNDAWVISYFPFQSTSVLEYSSYNTPFDGSTTDKGYYLYNNSLYYSPNDSYGSDTPIGNNITQFQYTLTHGTGNQLIAQITITATDNNNGNPYTLTTSIEAREGPIS